jgi:hypothetical protein
MKYGPLMVMSCSTLVHVVQHCLCCHVRLSAPCIDIVYRNLGVLSQVEDKTSTGKHAAASSCLWTFRTCGIYRCMLWCLSGASHVCAETHCKGIAEKPSGGYCLWWQQVFETDMLQSFFQHSIYNTSASPPPIAQRHWSDALPQARLVGSMGGCMPVDPPGPDIRITPHVQKPRVPGHQTFCSTLAAHHTALHKQQLLPPQSNGTNSAPLSCREQGQHCLSACTAALLRQASGQASGHQDRQEDRQLKDRQLKDPRCRSQAWPAAAGLHQGRQGRGMVQRAMSWAQKVSASQAHVLGSFMQ